MSERGASEHIGVVVVVGVVSVSSGYPVLGALVSSLLRSCYPRSTLQLSTDGSHSSRLLAVVPLPRTRRATSLLWA